MVGGFGKMAIDLAYFVRGFYAFQLDVGFFLHSRTGDMFEGTTTRGPPMSIAVLTQVYDEMRRLAIAGSVVAVGDFRLKKLLPPLEQAGAKAPVFAKVAEAVKAVVDGTEQTSSTALLDLTALVNSILYTQGDAAAPGTMTDIETTDLGGATSQASARVLKPLLEALTSTGSGRMELIKDAHERGAFRDLRLIKPALDAIDDPYGEIGDFVAEKILPMYGKAIAPELRSKLDLKGRAGHPRRLRLLHALDPAGARDLVKEALDSGSKEMKVVAVECLGAEKEDLAILIEQAGARAQEVRQAAYLALASVNDDAAVAVLEKAMTGKELEIAAHSLQRSRNAKLLGYIIAGADQEIAGLAAMKDKKEIGQKIGRIRMLLWCLQGRDDKDSEAFLLKLFGMRDDLAKIKGTDASGVDLNQQIVQLMTNASENARRTLAEAHEKLTAEELGNAFHAARTSLPADKVFAMFSPYITAKVDEKKKKSDAVAKRDRVCEAIGAHRYHYYQRWQDASLPALDPRWLDIAVETANLGMIYQLARPGNAAANAFLKTTFDALFKKAKSLDECHQVVAAMVHSAHPEATDAFLACMEKFASKKTPYYGFWFAHLIADLPRSAIPRVEAIVASLPENIADSVIGYLQQLRDKKE
jgi:hypothetical protein